MAQNMALNLRKAIVRNGLIVGGLCLALSLVLSAVSGGKIDMTVAGLTWPIVLALGVGLFTSWQVTQKISKGILRSLPEKFSFAQLTRGQPVNGIEIDWDAIDDYAIQLETRGYTRLGNFTTYPLSKMFVGVAACFLDRDTSTLVEVQHIQMSKTAVAATRSDRSGLHVSILSVLGGNITINTSDHEVKATNYLIRGDHAAVATFPGLSLLELLEKHSRLLTYMREKSDKEPLPGLNMNRYIYLQRERFAQARQRISALNGYDIATQIDEFEAEPRTSWSTSSSVLKALPQRSFEELDASVFAADPQPPIIAVESISQSTESTNGSAATQEAKLEAYTANIGQENDLRQQIESSANWFYWVAGLSLVNIVVALMGSNWAFAIGLGLPQVFIALAAQMKAMNGGMPPLALVCWIVGAAIPVFFLICGWFARFPSLAAFIAGFVLFFLDSLIFLLAGDWIGIAFHVLVLYFLWKGISASRVFKKLGK